MAKNIYKQYLKLQHARERPKQSPLENETIDLPVIFPDLAFFKFFYFPGAFLSTCIQMFYLHKSGLKVVTQGSLRV